MKDLRRYDRDVVKKSKSILLEVFSLLKEYKEHTVLIGGWAPYFILAKYGPPQSSFEHIGSVDIDIAFNHKKIPHLNEVYESIKEKLERNDYHVRQNENGQVIPSCFEKMIESNIMRVDLLASAYGGTGNRHRHQRIQDVLIRKVAGIDIAFSNNELFEIEGVLPNSARYTVDIRICGVTALLTMKTIAFSDDVSRIKDVYDMHSILRNYKEGVKSVVEVTKPFTENKLFLNAVSKMRKLFETIDSVGPVGFADFMLPENKSSEDWEVYRRNMYETIQDFLKLLSL